jgi:hypothetical protein
MRLGFWQKASVCLFAAIVAFSGIFWFVAHDLLAIEPGDITRPLLTIHGIFSYTLLVAIGSLLPLHVRSGLRRRHKLVTGLTVLTIMAVLAVTALVLYYGGEDIQIPAKWLHLGFGLGGILLFPIHVLAAGRSRSPVAAPRIADDMPT